MTEDAESAILGPPPSAPSGGEPDSATGPWFWRPLIRLLKPYAGKTGPEKSGLVFAVVFYWIVGLWAFQTHSQVFRAFSAYSAAFVAILYIARSGFWRRWAFWIEPKSGEKALSRRADLGENVVGAIIAIIAMVSTFALLSAILHQFLDNTTAVHYGNLDWNYTKAYLWNTIDAIPVLQINETIHWAIPPLFSTKLGQANEILFRLLVIAPGLSVIIRYLQYN